MHIAMSLLLLAAAGPVTSGQPCEKGTMYRQGKCRPCDSCHAGYEFNYTNFDRDMQMGYLSCPPCSPCPEGRYREPNSLFDTCRMCRKNCTAEYKMWKTYCGDTSPGDCGNCMDGYVQGSIDSNTPCIKETLLTGCPEGQYLDQGTCRDCEDCGAQNRTIGVQCRGQSKGKCGRCLDGYIEKETSKQCIKKTFDYSYEERLRDPDVEKDHNDNMDKWIFIMCALAGVILVGIAVCLWIIFGAKSGRVYRRRPAVSDSSATAEAGRSTESKEVFLQGSNGGLENDSADIETDGPTGSYVRRELEDETSCLLSNPAALPVSGSMQYPKFIITSEDKGVSKNMLMHIAKRIYGKQVDDFFSYLGIGKEEIYPEHERFLCHAQEYIDFKCNLLFKWRQSKGKRATLDVLCEALCKTGFHDVLKDVLKMYNEYLGGEANECPGEVGAGIGPSTAHCTQYSEDITGATEKT